MKTEFLILISIVLVAVIIFAGIKNVGAPSAIYGKCWEAEELSDSSISLLKTKGCTVEIDTCATDNACSIFTKYKVCCPFEDCPEVEGLSCQ